jgi:hypothetical protein
VQAVFRGCPRTAGRPKLSKRVYFHFKDRKPAPTELIVWDLVERTGWTLEYIEALPLARLHEYQQVIDGRAKGLTKGKGRKIA